MVKDNVLQLFAMLSFLSVLLPAGANSSPWTLAKSVNPPQATREQDVGWDKYQTTITDGDWTVVVCGELNGTSGMRRLRLGRYYHSCIETVGADTLDLSKPIYLNPGTGDQEEWTIVETGSYVLSGSTDVGGYDKSIQVKSIVLPETMEKLGERLFNKNGGVTNIVLCASRCVSIPDAFATGASSLQRLVLDLPMATTIGKQAFDSLSLADTSANDFYLPSVKSVGDYAFRKCKMTGVMQLPSLETLGTCAFQLATGLTGLLLGSATSGPSDYPASFYFDSNPFSNNLDCMRFGNCGGSSPVFAYYAMMVSDQTRMYVESGPWVANATAHPDQRVNHVYYIRRGDERWAETLGNPDLVYAKTAEDQVNFDAKGWPGELIGRCAAKLFGAKHTCYLAYGDFDAFENCNVEETDGRAFRYVGVGETHVFTRTAARYDGTNRYDVTGWKLEAYDADGVWREEATGDGQTCTFTRMAPGLKRLTWRYGLTGYRFDPGVFSVSPEYSETVAIDYGGHAPDAAGYADAGATITLTAGGLRGTAPKTRIDWGVALGDRRHDVSVPLTLTGAVTLSPRIVRDWEMVTHPRGDGTDAAAITDGNWILAVRDAGSKQLWICPTNNPAGESGSCVFQGSGDLELSGEVLKEGTAYSIVRMRSKCLSFPNAPVTRVWLPQSLQALEGRAFYGNAVLREIHFPDGGALNEMGSYSMANIPNLEHVVMKNLPALKTLAMATFRNESLTQAHPRMNIELQLPSLTTIASYCFEYCDCSASDIASWDLSGVKTIGVRAFSGGEDPSFFPCALLALPNLESIGGADGGAFYTCCGLGGIQFGKTPPLSLHADNFGCYGWSRRTDECWPGWKRFVFPGEAPGADLIAALTELVGDAKRPIARPKFVGSIRQPGWAGIVDTNVAGYSADEKAEYDELVAAGENVKGIVSVASGRKAWFIDDKQYRPKSGICVIVR